jgi:hypothetical protein
MDSAENPLAEFILESTHHIKILHEKCESLMLIGEAQTKIICQLRERIEFLEREGEQMKREFGQISLLN